MYGIKEQSFNTIKDKRGVYRVHHAGSGKLVMFFDTEDEAFLMLKEICSDSFGEWVNAESYKKGNDEEQVLRRPTKKSVLKLGDFDGQYYSIVKIETGKLHSSSFNHSGIDEWKEI